LIYLAGAYGLGMAHALEPGHGKTLVSSYMVAARSRLSDALWVGLLVTLSHTVVVLLLAMLAIAVARPLFGQTEAGFERGAMGVSGVLMIGIGLWLYWRRFIQDADPSGCECHLHHGHAQDALHPGELTSTPVRQTATSSKEIWTLGIASGMNPCPTAIAAMVASLSLGGFSRLPEALMFLLVFSAGLGTVMMLLGLGFVLGSAPLKAWLLSHSAGWSVLLSRASVALMVLMGGYLLYRSVLLP
jgi:ABC-type nickel/cobalt efflux system permease component RcnA